MTDLEALPALQQWPGLLAVLAVETRRMAHQHTPVPSDDRFSLASLQRSATAFVTVMRQHGESEKKLPWSFDVTCNEDRCRLRQEHAPEHGVAVRHIALHLRRHASSHHLRLRQQRLRCSLAEYSLLTVLCSATSDAITLQQQGESPQPPDCSSGAHTPL